MFLELVSVGNEALILKYIIRSCLSEKEPVSIVALLDNCAHIVAVISPTAVISATAVAQEKKATVGWSDWHKSELDVDGGPDGKNDKPMK